MQSVDASKRMNANRRIFYGGSYTNVKIQTRSTEHVQDKKLCHCRNSSEATGSKNRHVFVLPVRNTVTAGGNLESPGTLVASHDLRSQLSASIYDSSTSCIVVYFSVNYSLNPISGLFSPCFASWDD